MADGQLHINLNMVCILAGETYCHLGNGDQLLELIRVGVDIIRAVLEELARGVIEYGSYQVQDPCRFHYVRPQK